MAHSVTAAPVGRVNRRFLLLAFVLAILSAILAYAAFSRSGGSGGQSAGEVPVVVAKADIPAGTTITDSMVELRNMAESDVGDQPIGTTADAIGKVARYPVFANEPLLYSKVVVTGANASNDVLRNIIEGGQRAMAIEISQVVGAGGLILPGDHVDIYWVPSKVLQDTAGAVIVAENVEVLAVQQTLEDLAPTAPGLQQEDGAATPVAAGPSQRVPGSQPDPIPDAETVTLMLTPDVASQLFCAASSGEIRLAVRAFGDASPSGQPSGLCVILKDENR